jgi:hypothetical protein
VVFLPWPCYGPHREWEFGLELRRRQMIITPDDRCKSQIKRDVNIFGEIVNSRKGLIHLWFMCDIYFIMCFNLCFPQSLILRDLPRTRRLQNLGDKKTLAIDEPFHMRPDNLTHHFSHLSGPCIIPATSRSVIVIFTCCPIVFF